MTDHLTAFIDHLAARGVEPANAGDITETSRLIRAAADKGTERTLYASLRDEGGRGFGTWYSCRLGEGGVWHSKGSRQWTAEERKAWIARREADKAAAAKALAEAHDKAASEAQALWKAASAASPDHAYLVRKGIQAHGARMDGDGLLIPMREGKTIWSLQSISPDGSKRFQYQARKKGCYYIIPASPAMANDSTIVICEGFATGASIHEASGYMVAVAFDAGNLKPVAVYLRGQRPAARLVLAADNDRHKGERNPGIEAAQAAAHAVGGLVVWPVFPEGDMAGTDFNDLAQAAGIEAVKAAFDALNATPAQPEPTEPPSYLNEAPIQDDGYQPDGADVNDSGLPFYILGFNEGIYYYYPHRTKQIVALSPSGHTMNNLLQLANLGEWKHNPRFRDCKQTADLALNAANWMMSEANNMGVFMPESRVRGRGVWLDDGRVVYHAGNVLYVDGVKTSMTSFISHNVYVQTKTMTEPGVDELTTSDAAKLRTICESFTWDRKLSGLLLAGWLTVAPVCAMLKWRPHIWVTGVSGAGKTTARNLIADVLGDICYQFDGGTTEPALREIMGYDALPVIYDEAEAENASQKMLMENVLGLCRKASSGGIVGKFGQKRFTARFMMALFAINPCIKAFADQRRMTQLVLKKNLSATAQEEYLALNRMIAETITPEWRMGFISRVVNHMPTIRANILTFQRAARAKLGDAGAADQIAPMLAGLYFLSSTGEITQAEAEAIVSAQEWNEHTTITEDSDPQRLIRHIATSCVRYEPESGQAREVSIGELIISAAGRNKDESINKKWADKKLRQYGIKLGGNAVLIANKSQGLGRLLAKTVWGNGDQGWARTIADFTGATKGETPTSFGPGNNQRYTTIPLAHFLDDEFTKVQSTFTAIDEQDEEIKW